MLKIDFPAEVRCQLNQCKYFYREVFGIRIKTDDVYIPNRDDVYSKMLFCSHRVTGQMLFNIADTLCPVCELPGIDLRKRPGPKKDYIIWIKDSREADEHIANQKVYRAPVLLEEWWNIPGMTLYERVLAGIEHRLVHGEFMDLENISVCTGELLFGDHFPTAQTYLRNDTPILVLNQIPKTSWSLRHCVRRIAPSCNRFR